MSGVFWRDAASGSLIDPAMIPGTDIDGAALSSAAAGFRSRGGLLVERAEEVLGDWGGLAPVYSAPEAPVLLAAMDPIRTDVGVTADKLARAADRIDELAGVVDGPVRRLRELKAEAEEFVASVRGGVTVGAMDPDNPNYQAAMMTEGGATGLAMLPEGSGSVTLNWSEHTPSVNRNNELIEQVNDEFVRVHNAVAECVNGITGLIDGYCVPGMSAISDEQLAAMTETDYGAIGKGDRSCSESIGDGVVQAGTDMLAGGAALFGASFDEEWNWSHSGETAGAAWSGMLQGLGAIAMTGVPSIALAVIPDEVLPDELRAVRDWHAQQVTGLVEGIVGDPEMWAEDPVAAGAFAVTNLGSFFIPVAGGAAAVGKVGSVAARAGIATVRVGTRLDGAVSSAVVVNVGEVMARTGNTLTDLGRGNSAASRAELAAVLEAFEHTRVARHELHPPVGFGERMHAWGEQAAQLPARATEAMQHLGDRLALHGGGGLLPAFADGVPGGGHRFDMEVPTSVADRGDAVGSEARSQVVSSERDGIGGWAAPIRQPETVGPSLVPGRGSDTPTRPADLPDLQQDVVEATGRTDGVLGRDGTASPSSPAIDVDDISPEYRTAIDHQVTVIEREELDGSTAATFLDEQYRTVVTREPVTLYRVYGSEAEPVGGYASTRPATDSATAQQDLALRPDWNNTREWEVTIEVPEGAVLNVGIVGPQKLGDSVYLGGADQVLMPRGWGRDWLTHVRRLPSGTEYS